MKIRTEFNKIDRNKHTIRGSTDPKVGLLEVLK